jgi:hypothetical protein
MWCKVVAALEAANARKTVAGKEPEGSEESGSPGVVGVGRAKRRSLGQLIRDDSGPGNAQ